MYVHMYLFIWFCDSVMHFRFFTLAFIHLHVCYMYLFVWFFMWQCCFRFFILTFIVTLCM